MNINHNKIKRELKTIFKILLNGQYNDRNADILKLINFIENNNLLSRYINQGAHNGYDVESEYTTRKNHEIETSFQFSVDEEKQSYEIFSLLKYIVNNTCDFCYDLHRYYGDGTNTGSIISAFHNKVTGILVSNLLNHLDEVNKCSAGDNIVEVSCRDVSNSIINIINNSSDVKIKNSSEFDNNTFNELKNDLLDAIKVIKDERIRDEIENIVEETNNEIFKESPIISKVQENINKLMVFSQLVSFVPELVNSIQKFCDFLLNFR